MGTQPKVSLLDVRTYVPKCITFKVNRAARLMGVFWRQEDSHDPAFELGRGQVSGQQNGVHP